MLDICFSSIYIILLLIFPSIHALLLSKRIIIIHFVCYERRTNTQTHTNGIIKRNVNLILYACVEWYARCSVSHKKYNIQNEENELDIKLFEMKERGKHMSFYMYYTLCVCYSVRRYRYVLFSIAGEQEIFFIFLTIIMYYASYKICDEDSFYILTTTIFLT